MKIIQKAIKLSYQNFKPNRFQKRYHFAIAFNGTKAICLAKNNPIKTHGKAYRLGQKFNIQKYQDFPYSHAESHLVSKLLDTYNTIRPNWSLVVLRINRSGRILLSKPCSNCQKILDIVGLHKVYWSIDPTTFADSDRIIRVSE